MSPIKNFRLRTRRELVGPPNSGWTIDMIPTRTRAHLEAGAERVEIYHDHRGWHLEATYKEEV